MSVEEVKLPSNQKFGFFFTVVFALFAAYLSLEEMALSVWVLLTCSVLTLIVTVSKPVLLLPLNKVWMRLGFLLGKVVSPIVLGIIFFVLITPIAFVMRISGRDELRLKRSDRQSEWKERSPAGPDSSSFKNQF